MKYKAISLVYFVLFLICIIAGIYLQGGWMEIFLDYRVLAFILPAFILSLLLSGGIKGTARAYFDAFTYEVVDDRIERYKEGLKLIRQAGNLLIIWGCMGILIGIIILYSNLDKEPIIGSSMYFANTCAFAVLMIRVLFVHPAITALEDKTAKLINKDQSNMIYSDHGKTTPRIYLLLLFLLPVISVVFFLIPGADVGSLLMPAAVFIVPLSVSFLAAIGTGFKKIAKAINTALGKKSYTRYEIDSALSILNRLGHLSIEMGITGFVIKLIIMLAVIEDPEVILGQFILALVPVVYGIYIAAVLCFPLVNRLKMVRSEER